jgi:hypothetical protein
MTTPTLKWTATSGQHIEFCVYADYELDRQGRRRKSGYKEVVIDARIDGNGVIGDLREMSGHPTAVATFGRIGLDQAKYDTLSQAIDAAEESIADHNAAIDAHADALDAVDAESRRIESVMQYGDGR